MQNVNDILLDWYDEHARELPWRVSPVARANGTAPDPYAVWMSEIMLQQTTVAAVKAYFNRFMIRWPTINELADAEDADVMAEWAGLGYYARARNLLKCAREVKKRGGFPETEAGLRELPGIGPYTAAAIASIVFDHPAPVMDGNVERVMARLFAVTDPLPASKPTLYDHASKLTPQNRPGDYAQAVMDTPKAEKPQRSGHAYVVFRNDGAILLETRPAKGLLGGMQGFPGTVWSENPPDEAPPFEANWNVCTKQVTHVFTHFKLSLTVHVAQVGIEISSPLRQRAPFLDVFDPAAGSRICRLVRWLDASGHTDLRVCSHDPFGRHRWFGIGQCRSEFLRLSILV